MLVTNIQMWRGRRRAWMLQCSGGAPGAKEGCFDGGAGHAIQFASSVLCFRILKARGESSYSAGDQYPNVAGAQKGVDAAM